MPKRIGFGAHKLEREPWAPREARVERASHMLSRVLNMRTTVAFVGAGCTAALGYPAWQELARNIVARTREVLSLHTPSSEQLESLDRFEERLQTPAVPTPQLLHVADACRSLLESAGAPREFHAHLAKALSGRSQTPGMPNPYRALLELPIQRFVTSNYDLEIEEALAAVRHVPRGLLGLEPGVPRERQLSFVQRRECYDQLVRFLLAKSTSSTNMVFHCHGRLADPDTIVLTERDYQTWYLEQDEPGRSFRQALDILFGSNPILFVGFSLSDDDLVRPMRMLGARDRARKSQRPLFALLGEGCEGAKRDEHERLYQRYGVHVVPYVDPETSTPAERGKALVDAIARLERDRLQWRQGWLEKPRLRAVQVPARPPDPYYHYRLVTSAESELRSRRMADIVKGLLADAEKPKNFARVLVLVGQGGAGKSWVATKLLEAVERRRGYKGLFFWSSYYVDDTLTGIERAIKYMERSETMEGPRIARLRQCLRRQRFLLVFDGIERFLTEGATPGEGRHYNQIVRELLKTFADAKSKSTVVLTTRLWPEAYGSGDLKALVRKHEVATVRADELEGLEPFKWIAREEVSALCSLLHGHSYGVRLAAEFVRSEGREQVRNRQKILRRKLSEAPLDARVSQMMEVAVDDLARKRGGRSPSAPRPA